MGAHHVTVLDNQNPRAKQNSDPPHVTSIGSQQIAR